MRSDCCSAPPWLDNWHEYEGIIYGICESCREHCEFYDDEEEE